VFEDRLVPSGTLREPVNAMKRAQCIFVIGSADENNKLSEIKNMIVARYNPSFVAVLHQKASGWVHAATGAVHRELPLKRPLLLCGIARPERFTGLVKSLAVIPAKEVYCRDHHEFTEKEINRLCRGEFDGILTTEKDSYRLHTLNLVNCPDIWYLKIDLHFIEQNSKSVFFSHLSAVISS
jgi:tetraacyldisaccharide-1-P 4'-kinase